MTAELEFDLRGTVDWGRKRLVDFNIEKTSSSFFFYQSNNTGAIDVKMDWSVLEKKSYFKMLSCLSVLNWIEALKLSLLPSES